jgi:thiol-disulfide isomerase/thioredoxin
MKNIIFALLLTLSINLYAQDDLSTFKLYDIDGKSVEVIDIEEGLRFIGHENAVFLIIFGHRCPPCLEEIPTFIELANRYKDKLTIVAIEAQGYSSQELREFRRKTGINYTLISGAEHKEFLAHIAQRSGWKGAIPMLIAINKNGEVKVVKYGQIKESYAQELISKLNK